MDKEKYILHRRREIQQQIQNSKLSKDEIINDLVEKQIQLEADVLKWKKSYDYIQIADNLNAIMYLVQGSKFIYVNPEFVKSIGYSEDDILGLNFIEVVHPDYRQMVTEMAIKRLKGDPAPDFYEFAVITKSDEVRWLEVNNKLINLEDVPTIAGIAFDKTEFKKVQQSLFESENKFRILAENISLAIYLLDISNNKLIYANPYSEKLFGYTIKELEEISFFDVLHPDDKQAVSERILARMKGQSVESRSEVRIISKSGEIVWVSTDNNLVNFSGRNVILGSAKDVTDRVKYITLLKESEEKYRDLIESISEGVYFSKNGIFEFTSSKFNSIFGYETNELIGQPSWNLAENSVRNSVREQMIKKITTGDNSFIEVPCIKKDGSLIYVEISVQQSFDKSKEYGVVRDVSEKKKLEEAEKEKQKFNELLVRSLPHQAFLIGRDKQILAMNKRAEGFGAIVGDYCWRDIFKEEFISDDQKKQVVSNNDLSNIKCSICKADDAFSRNITLENDIAFNGRIYNTMWIPIDKEHLLYYIIDITERKQLELKLEETLLDMEARNWELKLVNEDLHDEVSERERIEGELKLQKEMLQMLNESLEHQVADEVRKNREKDQIMLLQSRQAAMGEMIGNIAHQWRQPLNTVNLMVYDLLDAFNHGEFNEDYLVTRSNELKLVIKHMSQTIDDFRNFFRPEKDIQAFNLKEVVVKAMSFVAASLSANNINISLDCSDEIVTEGFPNEYSQVLMNILNNAKDQFVETGCTNCQIHIQGFSESNKVILKVKDNGGGVRPDLLHRIFEPYFTTKDQGKGSGIGLYMSKVIIEKNMKGRLYAENTTDGVEFIIETGQAIKDKL